jgi:hypothetical protein
MSGFPDTQKEIVSGKKGSPPGMGKTAPHPFSIERLSHHVKLSGTAWRARELA